MVKQFEGTGVAMVTPFNDDFSVDYEGFRKLINFWIDAKIDYLALMGTTGEPATLSKEEKKELIEVCLKEVNNRVPIILGIGGNNTAEIIKTIQEQDFNGISAILSVSPYYNKPSQEGIYQHYAQMAKVSPVPLIIYNVPGRTGTNITAKTTLRLANDFKNIVAIKEASGNIRQIADIIYNKPEGFEVLSGDDGLTFPMLCMGAKGVISVIANSHPARFGSMVRNTLSGNFEQARVENLKMQDYIDLLFKEGSPSGVKATLSNMGFCKSIVRLPLVAATPELSSEIIAELKKMDS